jgi:hypothetical protein
MLYLGQISAILRCMWRIEVLSIDPEDKRLLMMCKSGNLKVRLSSASYQDALAQPANAILHGNLHANKCIVFKCIGSKKVIRCSVQIPNPDTHSATWPPYVNTENVANIKNYAYSLLSEFARFFVAV